VNSKLRVLLVQLPVPNNPALNTPLAAGYLKAKTTQIVKLLRDVKYLYPKYYPA
jgi:hypothetical protein